MEELVLSNRNCNVTLKSSKETSLYVCYHFKYQTLDKYLQPHNKLCQHLLQQPILILRDFQKLAKSGVPFIHILDITGDIYFS